MRFLRSYKAVTLAGVLFVASGQPALAAGNLTLPFNIPNPRITSWTDHHYPNRQSDGVMIRFDGATGYAYDGHRGTDFAVPANTPVVAADDGTVIYSEWSDSGGWGVVIDHATDRTAYFHNNKLFVYPGQHVSRGQLISLSGSTGNSTGPHVHFEVRDLQANWHSIDPYGWTGQGPDPWPYDVGYLWTSNPPVPFLLPLAFFSGARWNYWYGADGPPPPVSWRLQDGGTGLGGSVAQWDADPGANATRSQAVSGSLPFPGPGSHTLHLRVWDRAGNSADITYLYLYDVDPPTASARVDTAGGAINLHWKGEDGISGIKDVSVEVAAGGGGFRPLLSQSIDQPAAGAREGAFRFVGQPGVSYQLRVQVRDAARNAAPPVMLNARMPVASSAAPTVNDQAVLGPLPEQPDGSVLASGARQEHPSYRGSLILQGDGSVLGAGGIRSVPPATPGSGAAAVDIATAPSGSLLLLSDGSSWQMDGSPGPSYCPSPRRLLPGIGGRLLAIDVRGGICLPSVGRVGQAAGVASEVSVIDAATFAGSDSGLILDSYGALHPFDGADAAMSMLPSSWTLPSPPAGIALAGTIQAPAGILTDDHGDWQTFGSLLLMPNAMFGGAAFDPSTGLPIR